MTRVPIAGPWSIAPGDVVLMILRCGRTQRECYARVVRVRRRVVSRLVVAITTADGRRYRVMRGARLRYVGNDGRVHLGGVGVEVREML